MRASVFALTSLLLAACSPSNADTSAAPPPGAAEDEGKAVAEVDRGVADSSAYFAGGCFWGVEHYLEQLDGVVSVESGYMGGTVENPTYQQVTGKKTGHYESVEVRYDSKRVDYKTVAKLFFEIHDPTQADGQGPDIGPQYRSAVFVSNPEERKVVDGLIATLKERGYDVVTEVLDADKFWSAEEYHQNYYVRKGSKPYCHSKVDRFGDG